MSWCGERRSRSAARTGYGVQVNIVRHLAVLMVVQMKLHLIALADADETAGHIAAKRPEDILDTIGQALGHFAHLEIHDDFRRVLALDWWRDIGRLSEHGVLFALGFGIN